MKVHISRIALVHYATRDHLLSTSVHDHQLNITPEEIREKNTRSEKRRINTVFTSE